LSTNEEILKYAIDSGILNINTIKAEMKMQKRKETIAKHPHSIWQGKNGYWYTHIGEGKDRKKVKRKTKESIEDMLFEMYDDTNSFKEYFEIWMERQKTCGRSDNTIYKYKTDYARFIEGKDFENLKIDDVTEEDISKLYTEIFSGEKKYTYKCMRELLGYLKGVFTKAMRDKVIRDNPCDYFDIEMFQKYAKIDNYLFDDERILSSFESKALIERLDKKQHDDPCYIPQYAVRLSILTGMRVGELAGLLWEDVLFERKMIIIRHSEKYNRLTKEKTIESTKTHKIRTFPMTDEIYSLLQNVKEREESQGWLSESVFSDYRGRISATVISECMRTYTSYDSRFKSAKSIHANRRTFNSRLKEAGGSDVVASSLIGNTIQCNNSHYTYDTTELRYRAELVKKASSI